MLQAIQEGKHEAPLIEPQLGSIWSKFTSLLSLGCFMQATEPLVAKRTMICATLGKVSGLALWAVAEQQDVLLRSQCSLATSVPFFALLQLSEQTVRSSEAAAVGFGTAAKGAALLNEVLTQEMVSLPASSCPASMLPGKLALTCPVAACRWHGNSCRAPCSADV